MKKKNLIQPREKIPRKVKCGVIEIEELRMIKEVLKKENSSNKKVRQKGYWNKYDIPESNNINNSILSFEKSSFCDEINESSLSKNKKVNKENILVAEHAVNEESRGDQLKTSGLSHFMELEERKDLLMTNIDDDPLCINGPEAYDAVGWAPVKQEVPDDVEVSCVTITEIPLKPIEESISPAATPPTSSISVTNHMDNEDDSTIENNAKDDDIENDTNDCDSWWNRDDSEEESDDNSLEETPRPVSKPKSRPHSCEICSKKLSSKSSLRIHKKKKHQINIKFNCELCPSSFDLQRDLIKHRNEIHRDNDGRFICKDCGKYFSDYRSFLIHIKTHFEEEIFTGDVNIEKDCFKCEDCDKVFNREERLSLHKVMNHNSDAGIGEKLKQHEKNFVCHTCGKRFAFGCLLRDHINLHTGTKPYLCQSCGRSFAQKASLKQHARTHNSVRPFLCNVCNQGFFGKGDLKKHMRKHTGERPYVCEMCGDGFSQSSHLGVHRRSHTGERPFKCDVCSRGFTKKGDVVRHRRIHTGELPYLCQVCGKAFRQSTQCSNHIKNHHPDSLVSVSKNPVAAINL